MPQESYVQVTEGSGKKLHTYQRDVGLNTVEDEVVVIGEPYLPTYVAWFSSAEIAAAADGNPFELMADNANSLHVREIFVQQQNFLTTAATALPTLNRLTSAGTGGTTRAIKPLDQADPASGAVLRENPTTTGTVTDLLIPFIIPFNTATTGVLGSWHWKQSLNSKPIIVPAGENNGLAMDITTGGGTGALVRGYIIFDEVNF